MTQGGKTIDLGWQNNQENKIHTQKTFICIKIILDQFFILKRLLLFALSKKEKYIKKSTFLEFSKNNKELKESYKMNKF